MKKLWGSVAMVAATLIWGGSFPVQSTGMRFLDPVVFTALRFAAGTLALAALAAVFDLFRGGRVSLWGAAATREARRELLAGGVWCGIFLGVASAVQQYGIKYTSVAKAGFLTTLYIVIVPIAGIFLRRRTSPLLWFAAVLALTGTYLLCGGVGSIGRGEWLIVACALLFSGHILVIDRYAAKCDCVRLSCLQFAVATAVAALGAPVMRERWPAAGIAAALPCLLYSGIASGAVAFTLQMTAQKFLHPVAASLLMSLESVFAALGGWIFLGETLTRREFAGCAVIFAAAVLAQLPPGLISGAAPCTLKPSYRNGHRGDLR